jgi:hypothetical protein
MGSSSVATPTLDRQIPAGKSDSDGRSPGPMRESMGVASATGRSRIHRSSSHQISSAVMASGRAAGAPAATGAGTRRTVSARPGGRQNRFAARALAVSPLPALSRESLPLTPADRVPRIRNGRQPSARHQACSAAAAAAGCDTLGIEPDGTLQECDAGVARFDEAQVLRALPSPQHEPGKGREGDPTGWSPLTAEWGRPQTPKQSQATHQFGFTKLGGGRYAYRLRPPP